MAIQQRDRAYNILTDYVSNFDSFQNFASNSYDISQYSKYAFQVIVTAQAALNVVVKVQQSLDNTNWADYPSASVSLTANGTYMFNITDSAATYARVYFTFTAGSAKFQVLAFSKI